VFELDRFAIWLPDWKITWDSESGIERLTQMNATAFHGHQQLGPEDVYDATHRCPVCLSGETRRAVFVVQKSPTIKMLECAACGACSASHLPKTSVLDRYYAAYYAGARKVTFEDPGRFARHLAPDLRGLPRSGVIRILDFGGGNGALSVAIARDLLQNGMRSCAATIDLIDYEPPCAVTFPGVVLKAHRSLTEVRGQYDLILASAILEHIPEVHSVIVQLLRLAAPGAYFYARTPFVLPLAKLIRNFDITYPAHVHDMGNVFWNRFGETFGLRGTVIASRPSVIETSLACSPIRTLLAAAFKWPAIVELRFRGHQGKLLWNFVGGWEHLVQM